MGPRTSQRAGERQGLGVLVWRQDLNHILAGLYNVQFATINTQVPGLLNRNLGGAWQFQLLEDPLCVPVGTAKAAWVPAGGRAGGRSTCFRLAPDGRRPWPGREPISPTPTRGSADPGPSPAPFRGHLWRVLSLPHRPFLPVRSGSTRRTGLSCALDLAPLPTPPGPLIYMQCPAPWTVIYMSRPAVLSFSLAVRGPLFVAGSFAYPTSRVRSRLVLWLSSPRISGFESLP